MDLDEDGQLGYLAGRGSSDRPRAGRDEEDKHPSSDEPEPVSYFERCKQVGRIGPQEVKLDTRSAYGELIVSGKDDLFAEAMGSFCSVRANAGVFAGRYYYEVVLRTSGLM